MIANCQMTQDWWRGANLLWGIGDRQIRNYCDGYSKLWGFGVLGFWGFGAD